MSEQNKKNEKKLKKIEKMLAKVRGEVIITNVIRFVCSFLL